MRRTTQNGRGAGPTLLSLSLTACAVALGLEVSAASFPLRWRWSNPRPHGNNVVDMAYSSGLGLAVQVAEYGQLYTSVDLELWTPRESGTTNKLRAVTFMGARMLITGENGVVRYADSVSDIRPGQLLDGATDDWLEAVCASGMLAVAVGDEGAIYTSTNGIAWKRQANPEPSPQHWLRGVAGGGGHFVAVGETGTILTSTNGTNWTKRSSGTAAHLNRVTFGYNTFTIVGDSGVALVSTDGGLHWQALTPSPGANGDLFFAAYGGTDQVLVGQNEVRLSDDGVWSDELAQTNGPPSWTYYSAIGRRGFFFIAGQTGMMAEGYQLSYEPYLWLPTAESVRSMLFDVFWATNLFVAVGDRATVMTSDNGVDWTPELVPTNLMSAIFLGVGGTTNLLVAAGDRGSLMISPNGWTNLVVTNASGVETQAVSTLGVLWQAIEPRPTTNDLQGIAYFKGLYVVAGNHGCVLTSPDGTNWTNRSTPTTKLLSSLAASPDVLVASGDDGALLVSSDATNWTALNSKTTDWLYRVRYLNGGFVAVGQNGVWLTSPDGSTWTAPAWGSSAWLYDVAWLDHAYFAVGAQGKMLTSEDALAWTERQTITPKTLYAAATDTHYLVTAGLEGVILRSPVVPDLTPIRILDYSHSVSTNGLTCQNLFLFAGKPDQRFILDHRRAFDTNTWVTGPPLEIFDGSGTLYYLENLPAAEAPTQEFYRATLVP